MGYIYTVVEYLDPLPSHSSAQTDFGHMTLIEHILHI